MGRRESLWIGLALLALCVAALVAGGRLVAHGHVVVAVVLAAVASIGGVVILLVTPSRIGGRR